MHRKIILMMKEIYANVGKSALAGWTVLTS
jgi:hypothetical protein